MQDIILKINKALHEKHKELDLGQNPGLIHFPEEILAIKSLKILRVGGKRSQKSNITQLPAEINQLKQLVSLRLRNNRLSELPNELADLKKLEKIYLSRNNFKKFPEVLLKMPNIKSIHLTDNQIDALPENLESLANLESLFLGHNQIKKLPSSIKYLKNLTELYINDNPLTSLPPEIGELPSLKKIYAYNCKFHSLPKEITKLKDLKFFFLRNNPLQHPPLEIADQGIEAITNYFEELEKGTVKNYEAKLIIVGNGRIGKTSVSKRLISDSFDEQESSTHGIRIEKFSLPLGQDNLKPVKAINLKINTWDFGGQEIYHATHRFFLSTRALYLLVWDKQSLDSAINQPEKEEHFNFDYWLDYVKTLSQGSPVLMVQNKIDLDKAYIDNPNELIKEYNVKDFVDVSAATNENIQQLKQLIQKQFSEASELKDIIGFDLPASWIKVKTKLEELAQTKNYISYKHYLKICEQEGLKKESANNLSHNFLHQIGTILHFAQPKQLKDLVILKPRWATEAVYEALKNEEIMKKKGYFTEEDLENIWEAYELSEQMGFIELMKKFEILFEMPKKPHQYIVPQLLPTQKPVNLPEFSPQKTLILIYQYKFLHKGIITRLITKLSEFATHGNYWKNGILLQYEDTQALVEALAAQKQIHIKIETTSKKLFLKEIIQKAFMDINQDLPIQILVPYFSEKRKTTHYFSLAKLERRIENGLEKVECPLSFDTVSIHQLLTGEKTQTNQETSPKSKIQSLISLRKLKPALSLLLELAKENPDILNKLRILQGRITEMEDHEDLGIMTITELDAEKSKISRALLNFLNKV